MDMNQMKVEIERIKEKIVKEYKPKKIILFGSWAWGNPEPDSDVDLFIVKESDKNRLERERDLHLLLWGNMFPPMDLLIYTPEEVKRRFDIEDFFIKDIFSKGKVLYEQ